MFITWPQQLSNLQFDSGFQLWSTVDLVRPDHCFVASMVDLASGDRRTTFIASDLDLQTFLFSAPQGWKPDGVTILVPPEADGARNWRAFEVAAIERPISQEQSAEHPVVLRLRNGAQLAGLPLEFVQYADSETENVFSL